MNANALPNCNILDMESLQSIQANLLVLVLEKLTKNGKVIQSAGAVWAYIGDPPRENRCPKNLGPG